MFDAFEQDTEAQDKAILALTDKATSAAALNLIHATGKELELVGRWGPEGHILMICEAIAQGIHVDDLTDCPGLMISHTPIGGNHLDNERDEHETKSL
ncbi:hypothetical protein HZU83_15655 [Sphaerotilus montanus]|uniref:Uncharacterized protein n=1 Tax=Sphaerotilus montanus TaxID=522889 RepID=A0A7Y9QXU7_9BURK|nr:hypothetical protein [Sphaerotilus montanus]NYG33426.1 hypothetical protein [Sphaerotilus montanus]NZD58128.1 hypothetical protein [Sphaerotilus montanus]